MGSFPAEQLNYFRIAYVVLNEIPKGLRQVFASMWNDRVASTSDLKKWDDSSEVRNKFLAMEGGKTKYIPTNKSFEEWDCTALFQGILFSQTFALVDGHGKCRTLCEAYVKPLPSGAFHASVQSPTGNTAETIALALDQLRLLRRTLCHWSTRKIDKTAFDYYIKLAKDAFAALGQNGNVIDDIVKLTVEDFCMAKIQQLESDLEREKRVVLEYEQMTNSPSMNKIKSQVGNQVALSDKLQLPLLSLISKIVYMKNGSSRKTDLKLTLCHLQELKMDVLEELSVKNQKVYCIILKLWISSRPVFCIFTWNFQPKYLETDNNLNSDSKHVTLESGNIKDPNLLLFSSSNDHTKYSPIVLLWKIARVLEKKELIQLSLSLRESVQVLCLQSAFQKHNIEGQDLYMELTLPACGSDRTVTSLCNQIEYLPLLAELELSETHKGGSNIDSQSLKSAHVSYFSYRFPNQRQAEFFFDHLICFLEKTLALSKVQGAAISSVRNEAFFIFVEPSCSNSSLAIIAEKQLVTVKCRTASQFESKCVCLSVRTALDNMMESLCHVVLLSFKTCLQLPCEEIDCSCCCQDAESDSSSGFASETGNLCACASGSDPEDDLDEEQSVVMPQNKYQHADLGDDQLHPEVEPAWCILECPDLDSRNATSDVQALGTDVVAPLDSACFSESKEFDTSLLSFDSASSLNSYPPSPDHACDIPDFNQRVSPSSFECSRSHFTLEDKSLQSSVRGKLSESSYEEGLSSGESCSDAKTRKLDALEDTVDGTHDKDKHDIQSGHPSFNTGPETAHCREPQRTPDPSLSPVLKGSEKGTVAIDNILRQLHMQREQCEDLRQQIIQLKEQLKQSEEEKEQLQAEVGRQQFLEEREKRSEKILKSSMEFVAQQSKYPTASGGTYAFTGRKGKLLGGAGPLQEPGFELQQRLLEISNSLSEAELNKMKFLVNSKINCVRRAKIREGFELFEELSCTHVSELLKGIQRYDLLEKLGEPSTDSAGTASYCPTEMNRPQDRDFSSSPASTVLTSGDMHSQLNASLLQHDNAADETSDGIHLLGSEENVRVTGINEADSSSSLMSGNSENGGGDMAVLSMNDSPVQSESSSEEHTRSSDSSYGGFLSSESSSTASRSPELSANSDKVAEPFREDSTSSSCTSQDVRLGLSAALKNPESSDGGSSCNSKSSEDGNLQSSEQSTESESGGMDTVEAGTAQDESVCEVQESVGDVWSAPKEPAHLKMRCVVDAGADVVDSGPLHSHNRGQSRSRSRHTAGMMKDALPDGDISVQKNGSGASSSVGKAFTLDNSVSDASTQSKEWERLGARPRNRPPVKMTPPAASLVDLVPQEVAGPAVHGVANAFLARHSQDKTLHESLHQGNVEKVLTGVTSSQGASYVDGMLNLSERNKAKQFFGDCQAYVHSRPLFPMPGGGSDSCNAVGGCTYNGQFSSQTGLAPGSSYGHFTGSDCSVNGHFPSSSAFNSSVPQYQSDLKLGCGRPFRMGHFDREHPLGFHSGIAGSHFGSGLSMGTTEPQLTPSSFSAQRYSSFNEHTTTMTSECEKTQTPWTTYSGLANQSRNSECWPSASAGNISHADVHLGSAGLPAPYMERSNEADNRHEAADESIRTSQNATARSNESNACGHQLVAGANINTNERTFEANSSRVSQLVAAAYARQNREPQGAGASLLSANTGDSMANRDFGTESVESTDNSLLALEQRVEEACALVERVFREREEQEQFGREIERKEREIREQRARKRREREARELEEASRWPQQQEAVTGRSQWLCEHYQRHCRVRFPCCSHFFPCHRCHNNSKACDNEEAKASHATHLKCSFCHHEQEIDEDSGKCRSCGAQMSAYFCSICKHFTSVDKNPYHCKKCGICRIHKDKSFHCEVCNVCLDKRLEGKHKCRPDSGHDECCICLEDAFSGCQILPCSHKVHRECAIAMIQNGIRTCPVCRHPLYSPAPE